MIGYADQANPEDMLKLYDPLRLARNEMNVCIGLWAKGDMDFALLDSPTIEARIVEVRTLSDEIHQALAAPIISSIREQVRDREREPRPVDSGALMREAIFYCGESAYSFQYRDFASIRYRADDPWIMENMKFSIEEAVAVAKSMARLIDSRATAALARASGGIETIASPLEIFTLSAQEIAAAAKLSIETCERVLAAFAYPEGERNEGFVKVDARNLAAIRPIMRRDDHYLLFSALDLYEVLYQAPYFWMRGDKPYWPTGDKHRGEFTEEFAHARLASVFGASRTRLNVNLMRSGTVAGEIDVLVVFSNFAIVLQAKSKQLTAAARQGNERQIQSDFGLAVQEACDQGMECARMLFDPQIKLVGPGGELIERPDVEKVFVVCLVADHYPALAAQTRQFLKFDPIVRVSTPFVMDVFLLDAMAEMLDSPLHFLSYLDRRCAYADKVMANHELNILGYHLSQNLWMTEEASLYHLWDDFGIDLELSMLARRDGVAASWTPPGILTIFEQTMLGRVLKKIEREPNRGMVELGFAILGMAGGLVEQTNAMIDEMSRRARIDGWPHDFTVQMKRSAGLTFHCSPRPDEEARGYLLEHCARRKYVQRVERWFGVLIDPHNEEMRYGVMLESPWVRDEQLDIETAHMSRKTTMSKAELRAAAIVRPPTKVGRNVPCPCGSGKKSKRCCYARA